MNKRCTCSVTLLMVCFATTAVFAQEDFSAKAVNLQAGKDPTNQAKVYVTKDKMRIESSEPNGHAGAVIVNFSTQTSTILMPERKMYMQFAQNQGPAAQHMKGLFHIGDANDACADWQRISAKPGSKCRKVGSDTVNGRSTVKYEGTSDNGTVGYFWIDSKLHFPIKWQEPDRGGELQDIKEGSQPASLFEIPSDYQKFQMPAGMGNMQHPQ